ncbi:MAG TPA: class I SAM-dependent methyltransferase [Longimicrobiales bacterium]
MAAAMEQTAVEFDAARAEAFGERMVGAFNEAAVLFMISIGHRLGLFDALAERGAVTSDALAEATGLQERYVREWLSALAVGRVIELDDAGRFRLPPEHAALLTRSAPENLAVVAQYFAVLGGVEDELVRCFREGGGVPYERYNRFHEVMAEDSGQTVLAALHDRILPLVPGLTDRLAAGIRVADLGCGRGRALLDLAARYPASAFVGMDLSAEAIAWARAQAEAAGLGNVTFEARDLSDFDETAEPAAFDLVTTFDAVHDQARPAALLRGIARTLRPDGVYLMQDIRASSDLRGNLDHPLGALLYTISCMHCMTVSLAQGGEGLGTMWGRERAQAMLREAGFTDVVVHQLEHDIMNDYYVARPPLTGAR